MAYILRAVATLGFRIVDVLRLAGREVFIPRIVDGMRPRVVQRKGKPGMKAPCQGGLQAVVVALRIARLDDNVREVRVGAAS